MGLAWGQVCQLWVSQEEPKAAPESCRVKVEHRESHFWAEGTVWFKQSLIATEHVFPTV